jgi:hypothetical protein
LPPGIAAFACWCGVALFGWAAEAFDGNGP